ncbi:CAAX protease [Ureibacillus massiliensis 4400831 = CIP 108448 = CCUG 49529]|uniref:CAAX protease n=1 Tax=Ureibacillus massiliensis 4400831 = CIP 108448 = CCUG 49529 TaxID=1211035 RepID=A0A0A3JAP9_9BACL|nr:CPBP family intramembrane glutamic endopeptidase [Ureibacillus massiliensis]KGR92248.1 CAAX protease [Ureibacillus massiliensis 4400831 = CIP 108448 = CCUG 49529]RKJ30486.1 CPBP family intramembrane metalloprotease [Butyricicoccus sp. 1XD8-22]
MKLGNQFIRLLLPLIFVYAFIYYAYEESDIFWYIYAFTMLTACAISLISNQIKDELPVWRTLLFGIGYGTVLYGIIRFLYWILNMVNDDFTKTTTKFISSFGPNNIWHYFLLLFILVICEEMFWRGYIQQKLKTFVSPIIAISISSALFCIFFAISGYFSISIVAFIMSIFLGALYEWKKSMPLVIVAHEVFIVLLFLIIPFF